MNLNGNAISYLDNYDAREWLRLEYQALRNALKLIDESTPKSLFAPKSLKGTF